MTKVIKEHVHEVEDVTNPVIAAPEAALTTPAAYVNPATATPAQIAQALIDAGLMESS